MLMHAPHMHCWSLSVHQRCWVWTTLIKQCLTKTRPCSLPPPPQMHPRCHPHRLLLPPFRRLQAAAVKAALISPSPIMGTEMVLGILEEKKTEKPSAAATPRAWLSSAASASAEVNLTWFTKTTMRARIRAGTSAYTPTGININNLTNKRTLPQTTRVNNLTTVNYALCAPIYYVLLAISLRLR